LNEDPVHWLFGLEHLGMKFGLENISILLDELGHPQRAFASAHIAGTNGKGSVTAIVDTALRSAGYRSARFTSPHLARIEERFVIDGSEIDTPALAASLGKVRDAAVRLTGRGTLSGLPTFFEATTAAAFDLFRGASVDIAVVEVGLGGRLDSTNVLQPVVSAITTIAFDHQALLGDTLAAIAGEKAGIIKPGVPVVIGRLPAAADSVVTAVAKERGAPLIRAHDLSHGVDAMTPRLKGRHQRDNAVVAVGVLRALRDRGFDVTRDDERYGVEHVEWPGRLELVRTAHGDVLLDAAHNPAGARALAEYLREAGWTDATLVFGAMADKDVAGMLAELSPYVSRIVCTAPATPRAMAADAVRATVESIAGHPPVQVIDDPRAALDHACRHGKRVVVAGSMFLIGPLRDILR
jgi:dihydrofolate synthase/folylpolyglutamate synthase